MMSIVVRAFAIALIAIPVCAKGPKDSTTTKKYQRGGGYSQAAASESKYAKPESALPARSSSRMPSQPVVKKGYRSIGRAVPASGMGSLQGSTSRNPASRSESMLSNRSKYSRLRPGMTQTVGVGRTSAPAIRIPDRTRSTPSDPKVRPSFTPTKKPPIVFYPGSSRSDDPLWQSTTRQPSASKGKYYRPPLRPEPSRIDVNQTNNTIIVNRPQTTINQSTTNVIRNPTNVNQWFNDNQWQNRVTVNSRHWNDRPWWYHPDYGDWHHGNWHPHYADGGLARNDWRYVDSSQHAWLNGLAAWGLGNLVYRTGYQTYANPFYARPLTIGSTVINYSQPIAVQVSAYERACLNDKAKAEQLRREALRRFDLARRAFYEGELPRAMDQINAAIALMPDDTSMHEFRALVLFAQKRYRDAAEAIHAVVAVAPGWDWTTLSGLYPDIRTYTEQLRELERYTRFTSREPHGHFLLAYHYITLGRFESAVGQLNAVLQKQPDDRLVRDLRDLISSEGKPEQPMFRPEYRVPTLGQLQGKWRASRPTGRIDLELKGDRFEWDYDLRENNRRYRGRFDLAQDVMVLATDSGSQWVGKVALEGRGLLHFHLLNDDPDDPGIVFERR